MEKLTCEIYLGINEDGGYVVATSDNDIPELLADNEGGNCCKIVKLTVKIATPAIEEIQINVPDTVGKITVTAE